MARAIKLFFRAFSSAYVFEFDFKVTKHEKYDSTKDKMHPKNFIEAFIIHLSFVAAGSSAKATDETSEFF